MIMIWHRAAALAALVACLFPSSAIAAQARAFLAEDGTVYAYGYPPGEYIEVGFPATKARRRIRAGWCWLRVAPSEAYPSQPAVVISGSQAIALDPAALPVRNVACKNNTLTPPQTSPWQDTEGAFYVPLTMGLTSGATYTVEYPNQIYTRKAKANACGYITIRDAAELGDGLFLPTTDGSSAYFALAALPAGTRLYCHEPTGTELRADRDSFPLLANSSAPPAGVPGPSGPPPFTSPVPPGAIACSPTPQSARVDGAPGPLYLTAVVPSPGPWHLYNFELLKVATAIADSNGLITWEVYPGRLGNRARSFDGAETDYFFSQVSKDYPDSPDFSEVRYLGNPLRTGVGYFGTRTVPECL